MLERDEREHVLISIPPGHAPACCEKFMPYMLAMRVERDAHHRMQSWSTSKMSFRSALMKPRIAVQGEIWVCDKMALEVDQRGNVLLGGSQIS